MKILAKFFIAVGFASWTFDASAADITPSDKVPMMEIQLENNAQIVDRETYISGTLKIDPLQSGKNDYATEALPSNFRGRGNHTWIAFDKKPYKIKLDSKAVLMGMDKNKHFALLAHADDVSGYLRNTIGFELSRRMGLAWTPEQRPVQLTMNNQFEGLYFLTQTIRVDKTRVNIVEQADLATAPDEITGGWLIEIDNYDRDPHVTVTEGGGSTYPIWFTYKSPEELSPEQAQYLTDQMTRLNELIHAPDKSDTSELEKMLDFDAFARYYLVQEIADDTESFHGSCFLYRDRGVDSKWTFGPVWDFGNSFERSKGNLRVWQGHFHQVWVAELLKFPAIQERVRQTWHQFVDEGLNGLFDYIHEFEKSIEPAMEADHQRWPDYGAPNYRTAWAQTENTLKENLRIVGAWYGKIPDVGEIPLYLRGDFNGWGLSDPFTYDPSLKAYRIAIKSLSTPFKIATSDWVVVDLGAANIQPIDFQQYITNDYIDKDKAFKLIPVGANIHPQSAITDCDMVVDVPEKALYLYRTGSVSDLNADDPDASLPAEYFTLDGRRVEKPRAGIFIEKRGVQRRKILISSY